MGTIEVLSTRVYCLPTIGRRVLPDGVFCEQAHYGREPDAMDNDSIDDLGGPSPEGRRGGSAGTGEFLEARATLHHEDGTVQDLRLEVSALNFRRQPEGSLVGALEESAVELDDVDRIEVEIGGEALTLKQTGWEIQ